MKNVSISLTDSHAAIIEAEIAAGGYASVSEVIRAALREYFDDNPAGVPQEVIDRDVEEYLAARERGEPMFSGKEAFEHIRTQLRK